MLRSCCVSTKWRPVVPQRQSNAPLKKQCARSLSRYEHESDTDRKMSDVPTRQSRSSHKSDLRPHKSRTTPHASSGHDTTASRRVTTFSPITPAGDRHDEAEHPYDQSTSFLQQKARSVMDKRAEAASLSSMTKAERAAFDDIWKLFEPVSPTPALPERKPISQTDTDFRSLLELFDSFSRNDRDDQADADTGLLTEDVRRRQSEVNNVDATAVTIVEDIASSLEAAVRSKDVIPEVAMWEVCEEEIFPLTKLLVPSRSKLSSNTPVAENTQPQFTHPLIPSDVPLIPLLSKVYPATLLLAIRLYQRHYPTSPYCLALLPYIKSLGPTSYVLGANTHFYNTLLAIRWDFYSDLDEINQLLAEMDRTGLEYDRGTAELLQRISTERQNDLRNEACSTFSDQASTPIARQRGVQWWKTPLVERSWSKFQHWKAVVARKLEENGMGQVMREGDLGADDTGYMNDSWSRVGRHAGTTSSSNDQYIVTL